MQEGPTIEKVSTIEKPVEQKFFLVWVKTLAEKKTILFTSFIVLLCVGVVAVRFFPFLQKKKWESSLQTDQHFAQWEKGKKEVFLDIEKGLKTNPERAPYYEGKIAQKLLLQKEVDKAMVFGNNAIERTEETSPFYAKFSKTTFLLSQALYEKALDEACLLRKEMEEKGCLLRGEYSSLFLENLVRIAFVEKLLGHKEKELLAWNTVEKFLQEVQGKEKVEELLKTFQREGTLVLEDYIQHRKEALE
jgi:hypothetical protein